MSAATSFTNGDLFSCKISLQCCKSRSPVWRRVLVPVDYTFKDLHDVIMAVMEWDDYHLHMFRFKHPSFGNKIEIHGPSVVDSFEKDDDTICYLPESTLIAPYVQRLKQKIQYEYDFGCSWEHVIEFEKKVDASCNVKYPKCIKGKGMPPPEDDPDSERSEVFDLKRMDSKLSKCRQFVKTNLQNNPAAATASDDKSTEVKPLQGSSAKRLAEDSSPSTVLPSTSTETDFSTIQEPPAKRLAEDCPPSIVLPSTSTETDFSTIPSVYANAINYSPRRSDELTSSCRRCEEIDANMDYDDFYGKHVAINLKLVTDREMRANLRYDIQLAINKYSEFQKRG